MIRASSFAVLPALMLFGTAASAQEKAAPATAPAAAAPAPAAAPAAAAAPAPAAAPAAAAAPAPAAAPAAAAAPAPAAATPAAALAGRPYVETAASFLKGLAHSNRSGDAGDKGWQEAKAVAADKITFKVAGRDLELDLAGKKSGARVVRFEKLSTLRDGQAVKGVSVENIEVRLGTDAYHAKGRVMLDEKDGKWTVTALEID